MRDFVQGLRLTYEDVGLCLDNGRRLMRDARFRTTETRLALRELALEELAKGSMITMRIELQAAAKQVGDRPQPWPDPTDPATAQLVERWKLLSDEALRQAFWDHDIKLEHLEMLLTFIERARAGIMARPLDSRGLPLSMRVPAALFRSPRMRAYAAQHFFAAVAKLREAGIDRLDDISKRATFVDLDRAKGRCVPPVADLELMIAIWVIDYALVNFLKVSLARAGYRRRWTLTQPGRSSGART